MARGEASAWNKKLVAVIKGTSTAKAVIGDVRDRGSLYNHLLRFNAWQHEKNYSLATIEARDVYIRYFLIWCDERGLGLLQDITKPILERYQRYLLLYRKGGGHTNSETLAVGTWGRKRLPSDVLNGLVI
jgi:hypothetical protein